MLPNECCTAVRSTVTTQFRILHDVTLASLINTSSCFRHIIIIEYVDQIIEVCGGPNDINFLQKHFAKTGKSVQNLKMRTQGERAWRSWKPGNFERKMG
jgi:hypothetical protein